MRSILLCGLAAVPLIAAAGRPLATDDAATAEAGSCQIESWSDKRSSDRAWVVAPACGLADGVEIGASYSLLRPSHPVRAAGGAALKWAPAAWKLDSGIGTVNFGLKAGADWAQPAGGRWTRAGESLLGLASWQLHPAWTVHANFGATHDAASRTRAALLNLALVWTAGERLLLVAETQRNSKPEVFGGAVGTVGARWWLAKDVLGLDLTASRGSRSGNPTTWTLGLGWYGLGL